MDNGAFLAHGVVGLMLLTVHHIVMCHVMIMYVRADRSNINDVPVLRSVSLRQDCTRLCQEVDSQ